MIHHMVRMFIETEAVTTDWTVGKEVLSAFAEAEPRLVPEAIYSWSTKLEDFTTVDACERYWAWITQMRGGDYKFEFPLGLGWRRKKAVRYQAEVKHSQNDYFGKWNGGGLSLYAAPNKTVDWLPVFRRVCAAMTPQYGLLHQFTNMEDVRGPNGAPENYFRGGIIPAKNPKISNLGLSKYVVDSTETCAPGTLDPKIPNLGWSNYLGGDFAKAVNPTEIAAAGFAIEKIGAGYLIQVTERLQDVENNFGYFSEQRVKLKKIFPDDFFLIKHEPVI
ncbi:hypothetical protein J2X72_003058 [Phyllobacterium sp. 1468]|uniref:hypothetical protein n=1 Tax=Phyllobacterium sp. 1468 TaxID=2817759 RepID=UPI00285BE58B|nr:hypothetical protein [Phyllobacterium sp. 1468]MDR6634248.1 hypothetical protein [Phyllobacterium sp. 1468]